MATMTVRKTTIMVELVMENQWILSSGLPRRYTSQRLDHDTSDSSHTTSYVKITYRLRFVEGVGSGGWLVMVSGFQWLVFLGYSEYLVV